jgi:hypothetical protein
MNIIQENRELLNTLSAVTGDVARLAHRLSETTNRLEAFISQAEAQFKVGDHHATFNQQFIQNIQLGLWREK